MSRYTTIEFPVFSDFIIHVEVAKNIEKAIGKYPSIADFSEEDTGESDGVAVYDGGQVCFIFLKPNVSVGTIAHESWHAIEHMMERFNVRPEGEVIAYHLGYLVDKVFRFLRRK
jgi:hypothetical protein